MLRLATSAYGPRISNSLKHIFFFGVWRQCWPEPMRQKTHSILETMVLVAVLLLCSLVFLVW